MPPTKAQQTVNGVTCGKAMLDLASKARGPIDHHLAEQIWAVALDGNKITKVENDTVRYLLAEMEFAADAKDFLVRKLDLVDKKCPGHLAPLNTTAGSSQYQTIAGVQYERDLFNHAVIATKGGKSMTLDDAKKLWTAAMDGNRITDSEFRTIDYVMAQYKAGVDAYKYLEDMLAEKAAGRKRAFKGVSWKAAEEGDEKATALEMSFATAPPGGFASPYERAPGKNFAFLIPGDEELFVGGGALNGAVGKFLLENGKQAIAFERQADGSYILEKDAVTGRDVPKYNKTDCVYRRVHEAMFRKASAKRNTTVMSSPSDIGDAPLVLSAARVYSDCDKPFGAAFLNVFKAENRPHSDKNIALLYTVGALGRNKKAEGEGVVDEARAKYVKTNVQDFLNEIYLTGRNVAQLVLDYNSSIDPPQTPVHAMRLPIVSGGVFINPDTTPKEVALALLWGVNAALKPANPSIRPDVELMPGKDMQEAYDVFISGASPSQWNTPEGRHIFAKLGEVDQMAFEPSAKRRRMIAKSDGTGIGVAMFK